MTGKSTRDLSQSYKETAGHIKEVIRFAHDASALRAHGGGLQEGLIGQAGCRVQAAAIVHITPKPQFKKDKLAGRYNGREVKVDMMPGTHYCILIQFHKAPVADFIESSTLAKFNYAREIREQQMELIRQVEDIFQDDVSETK